MLFALGCGFYFILLHDAVSDGSNLSCLLLVGMGDNSVLVFIASPYNCIGLNRAAAKNYLLMVNLLIIFNSSMYFDPAV